jgi:branched-chain amino acid transport system substrate-binding protein
MDVANAPGEKILPGELAKALEILAAGGDIDYVGASASN